MADGDRCLNQLELLTLNISKFEIVFSVYGEAIFLFIRLEREHFNKYCTCQQKLDTKLKKSGIKNESMYKIHQLF